MEYVKNKYSIAIKKCCASCANKVIVDDSKRKCLIDGSKHSKDFLCFNGWKMSPGLDNAGKGDGKVLKKAFIEFKLNNGFAPAAEFEAKYGSRYMGK